MTRIAGLFSLALAALATAVPAAAGDAPSRITIEVGYGPGGGYDASARLVAEHLGRFLPGNPAVIVTNEPGAGSLRLAKLVTQSGATDGSELAMVSSALALNPVFDPDNRDFDPLQVHYIASVVNLPSYCITPVGSGIETLDQLLHSDAKVGASGKVSSTYTYTAALRAALGGSFQIVTGFKGAAEIELAMERGEIQAECSVGPRMLLEGGALSRYRVLAELAPRPRGTIPGVPFLLDRVGDPETRAALALVFGSGAIHHPFLVAPGTPPETVERLRAAFLAMAADPAFRADAEARGLLIDVTGGAEVEATIRGFLAEPEAVRARARALVE